MSRRVLHFAATALGLAMLGGAAAFAQSAPAQPQAGATVAPQATDTPGPATSATPQPAATSPYKFVYKPTPSPVTTPFPGPNEPEIQEIDLSDTAVLPPATVYARVLTNDNVVAVNAEALGGTLAFAKSGNDEFRLEAAIPDVPMVYRSTYDVTFVAQSRDGRTVTVVLPLTLRKQ